MERLSDPGKIIGCIDGISSVSISGWAFLPESDAPIRLTLRLDGEDRDAVLSSAIREDVWSSREEVRALCRHGMSVGFSFGLRGLVSENRLHRFEIIGPNGVPVLLEGVTGPAQSLWEFSVAEVHGRAEPGAAGAPVHGWALVMDKRAATIRTGVSILVRTPTRVLAHLEANHPRPDVAAAMRCDLNCGFVFKPHFEDAFRAREKVSFIVQPEGVELLQEAPVWIGSAAPVRVSQSTPTTLTTGSRRVDVGESWPSLAVLFDDAFYDRLSGLVFESRTDSLRHFAKIGLAAGVSPSPLFDAEIYLARAAQERLPRPDLGEPVVLHWLKFGLPTWIVPTNLFDESYYRATYKDYLSAECFGFDHYITGGLARDLKPNTWFDPLWYRQTVIGIPPTQPAFLHFLEVGAASGFAPHKFFLSAQLKGTSPEHWATYGPRVMQAVSALVERIGQWSVSLLLALFYPTYYTLVVPDLEGRSPIEHLQHFLVTGLDQNLPPSPLFEPEIYRRSWERITGEELGDRTALLHWLEHGRRTVPVPTRMYSDLYYRSRYVDMIDPALDTFEHYVRAGIFEDRQPNCWFEPMWYASFPGNTSGTVPSYIRCLSDGAAPQQASRLLWLISGAAQAKSKPSQDSLAQIERFGAVVAATEPWLKQLPIAQLQVAALLFMPETYDGGGELTPDAPTLSKLAFYLSNDLATGRGAGALFVADTYAHRAEAAGISLGGDPALLHFLRFGLDRRIVPTPVFDEEFYLQSNPDLVSFPDWLFLHFIKDGLYEGRRYSAQPALNFAPEFSVAPVQAARRQLISRASTMPGLDRVPPELQPVVHAQRRLTSLLASDVFNEIMTQAQAIEPLVGEILEPREILAAPIHDEMASKLQALLARLRRTRYDHIICVPWVRAGGADLVSGFLSSALRELYPRDAILLLLTDQPNLERRDWIAPGVDIMDISDVTRTTPAAEAERLLLTLIRGLQPKFVFNVNSRLCWQFMRRFGSRLETTRLLAYLFCWDQTAAGVRVGYPSEFFEETQAGLTALLTDTRYLKDELTRTYSLPSEVRDRIIPLNSPFHAIPPALTAAEQGVQSAAERNRPLFLWGGRLDLQKRFDVLVKIAGRMPDCDFNCWGAAMLSRPPVLDELPPNITMMGSFKHLSDLPLSHSDGWVFTSAWEGMPTTLIELGVLGMPIAASAVGGVPELIDHETGWLVSPFDDADAFVACLREMLASPEERCARARALQARTCGRHNMSTYKAALAAILDQEAA